MEEKKELDEARAEIERLRALLPPSAHTGVRNGPGEGSWAVFAEKVVAERDEARAEVERLRTERDAARAEAEGRWITPMTKDEFMRRANNLSLLQGDVDVLFGELERLRERLAVERTPNGAGKWNAERVLREKAERERDEVRAQVKAWQAEELARRTERDEARAEVERLQERVATQDDGLRYGEQVCARLVAERDEARAEVEVLRRERDDLHGAVMLAEERGAEWAIRAKAQVVYALAGDASYVMLAREVCEQARGKR